MVNRRRMEPMVVETELSIPSILSRAAAVLREQPLLYLTLAALSLLPSTLMGIFVPKLASGAGGKIVVMVFGALISAAIAYAVYQSFLGKKVGLGEALRQGLEAFGRLFVLAFLLNILIFLGTLLLIIPGVIIACMCSAAVPACVVEDLGPADSIMRSFDLTDGYRLKIFLLFLPLFALSAIILSAAGPAAASGGLGPAGVALAGSLALVIPVAVIGVVIALVYADLRLIKEGLSADMLGDAFD